MQISRQKQANSGIGWSDEGIAKYNEIYDLVENDRQLRGATFNQELLKVHQRRSQKNKKTTERNVDEIASESCPFPACLPSSVVSSVLRVGSRQLSPVRPPIYYLVW